MPDKDDRAAEWDVDTRTIVVDRRLPPACVRTREHGEAERLLEEAVRYLNGQEYELVSAEKEIVGTDD